MYQFSGYSSLETCLVVLEHAFAELADSFSGISLFIENDIIFLCMTKEQL